MEGRCKGMELETSEMQEDAAATTSSAKQSLVRIKPSVSKYDESLYATWEIEAELPGVRLEFGGVVSWGC